MFRLLQVFKSKLKLLEFHNRYSNNRLHLLRDKDIILKNSFQFFSPLNNGKEWNNEKNDSHLFQIKYFNIYIRD